MSDDDGLSIEGYPNNRHFRRPTDFCVMTLRIREGLRARLEESARRNGNSTNYEIAMRLVQSLDAVELEARIEAAVRRALNGHADERS